jgi:TrmH family RNA methyltransferase
VITSPQNDRVKLAYALQTQVKVRRKEGKMALEGLRLVRDALERGLTPDFILYDPDAINIDDVEALVGARHALPLQTVTTDLIRHVSSTEEPQGIVGVFPIAAPALPETPERVLILDNLRDPGNMGTILRTAAAAGVEVALLSPGCVDAYNPKVLRGGMGAHFRLPILEASWTDIAVFCRDLTVYLADMQGDVAYDAADWRSSWALIIGSEAHGESDAAAQLAHRRVYIPMASETESLNAGVAAGVILFEAARQRKTPAAFEQP